MLAHLRRGETYQRRGELDEAARDFRTAATLDPTATRPLEALGDVLYEMKRFERAADTYAREPERRRPLGRRQLQARTRAAIGAAISTRRSTTLASTLRLNERLADAHYLMGLCLRDRQRHGGSHRRVRAGGRASPPDISPAREELADLYGSAGRHDRGTRAAADDRDPRSRSRRAPGRPRARAGPRRPRRSGGADAWQRARAHARPAARLPRARAGLARSRAGARRSACT